MYHLAHIQTALEGPTPERYEPPVVKVLGAVTDLTQAKPGRFFDYPGATIGGDSGPPRDPGGTVS
jgi:hypothetical protein